MYVYPIAIVQSVNIMSTNRMQTLNVAHLIKPSAGMFVNEAEKQGSSIRVLAPQ